MGTDLALFALDENFFRVRFGWSIETFFIFGAGALHNSNNVLNWFSLIFKKVNPLVTYQGERVSSSAKKIFTELTYGRALKTLIFTFAEKSKSFFEHAKSFATLFVRTIQVSNKINDANLMPIIRLKRATHRNCSQLFQNCWERNIASSGVVDFPDD